MLALALKVAITSVVTPPGKATWQPLSQVVPSGLVKRTKVDPLPAVALTAHARDVDRARALDAGFDMHIAKPVDVDQLVIGIGTLIARRRIPAGTTAGNRSARRTRARAQSSRR